MSVRDEILSVISDIEYVSFDIYDTLLFRMVRTPERIFEKTYEQNPSMFPDYIDSNEWREIRAKTEWFVRAEKKSEVTIDDVYNALPSIIENREAIKNAEINCEIQYSYLNPEIESLLIEIREKYQKKIILISDMYMSKSDIIRILKHNGLNMNLISGIYVSSESGLTKRSGNLYEYVVSNLMCNASEIVHIGDNRAADYIKAREKGLKAVYYPLLSEGFSKYPYLVYESEAYGSICDEIHSLRFLAANAAQKLSYYEKKWYEIGAMIIGPLLTYSAEWVINTAEQNKIKNIFPMMREGKFLTELLQREKNARHWNGKIEPMYISRKALYPGILSVLKCKDVQYNLSTHKMTVGHMFETLNIGHCEEFSEYLDKTLSECKSIYIDNVSVYDKLEKYLCNYELIDEVKQQNADADNFLFGYLCDLGLTREPYITFDVGWRGNAQNAIQRIMNKHHVSVKGMHLLINGKKFLISEHNLEDKCDIRGFTANFGRNEKTLNEINIPIFEMFMMCDEGTTIGYEMKNNQYIPNLKEVKYDQRQFKAMRLVQEGILSFQSLFFEFRNKKPTMYKVKSDELLALVARLMNYPTKLEADIIGKMSYDQNFGIDSSWQIISEKKLEEYRNLGYAKYVYQNLAREDEWYQGMDVYINPLENYRRLMFEKKHYIQFKYYLLASQLIHINESIVLVGAGVHLNDIMGFLEIMNMMQKVEMILDSNEFLSEMQISDQKVYNFSKIPHSKVFVITAIKPSVINELSKKLINYYGSDITIYKIDY